MYNILLLFVLLSFLVNVANTNVFTSVSKLGQLARVEQEMLASLESYIRDSKIGGLDIPENVKIFYRELSDVSERTVQAHFMENPINAFHFIHRMHVTWPTIIAAIDCEQCTFTAPQKEFVARLSKIEEEAQSDTQASGEDLQWSAMAVVRLWQTYKLHLPSLFRGQILNTRTDPLSLDDILYICDQLDFRNDIYKEIVWLKALLKEMAYTKSYSNMDVTRVCKRLASAYFKYGMPWVSVELLEKQMAVADANDQGKLKRDLAFYTSKMNNTSVNDRRTELKPSEADLAKSHYESLCRGHITRRRKVLSRLRCMYHKITVPIYRVKEEILNYDPRISLFHEVLTNTEIAGIKGQAMRMNSLIHINPTCAEDAEFLQGTGDRMATWMFYLNDVKAGGATVFLDLNITVPVKKGAAVFWYNIRRNGEIDQRTLHAGCPVLLGSKWVANKWIRQHGQIFRRKCGLKINSIDTPL